MCGRRTGSATATGAVRCCDGEAGGERAIDLRKKRVREQRGALPPPVATPRARRAAGAHHLVDHSVGSTACRRRWGSPGAAAPSTAPRRRSSAAAERAACRGGTPGSRPSAAPPREGAAPAGARDRAKEVRGADAAEDGSSARRRVVVVGRRRRAERARRRLRRPLGGGARAALPAEGPDAAAKRLTVGVGANRTPAAEEISATSAVDYSTRRPRGELAASPPAAAAGRTSRLAALRRRKTGGRPRQGCRSRDERARRSWPMIAAPTKVAGAGLRRTGRRAAHRVAVLDVAGGGGSVRQDDPRRTCRGPSSSGAGEAAAAAAAESSRRDRPSAYLPRDERSGATKHQFGRSRALGIRARARAGDMKYANASARATRAIDCTVVAAFLRGAQPRARGNGGTRVASPQRQLVEARYTRAPFHGGRDEPTRRG